MLIQCPTIKSKYRVEVIQPEGAFLLSETEKHILEGPAVCAMLPFLNGKLSWLEIGAILAPIYGAEAVENAARIYLESGHVEEGGGPLEPAAQVLWTELGVAPNRVVDIVSSTNFHILPLGAVDSRGFLYALSSLGFRSVPAAPPSITVAIVDDLRHEGLADLNRRMLALGTPWAIVKPHGLVPTVGPFLRLGRTACWHCLDDRLEHNRALESYARRRAGQRGSVPVTRGRIALGEAQAVSLAMMQILRWLVHGAHPTLESQILEINVVTGAQMYHHVTRRPQCPVCGDPTLSSHAGRPIHLGREAAVVANENGSRPETPEITFRRYAHHVSSISGIVSEIVPAPFIENGPIKTYVAGHNFALKNDGLYFLKDGLRSKSSGKGRTDAQARTSALCEALERFSGVYRGDEERILSSFAKLGSEAVDPRSVMLYSEQQYDEREAWLARNARFQIVPRRFDAEAEIHWSPVWSLTEERRKWLPASQLYYGFSEPDDKFFCWADSNGCAAGGTREDAVLQGALEVVERDSVALWWINRLSHPEFDLESLNEPYIAEYRAFYRAHNRSFWVLDLTADLGIPCMAAINRRLSGPTEDIIVGFGAHFDPAIAVSRALTEMNQFIPAVLNVASDGITKYAFHDRETLAFWQTAKLDEQPYLKPGPQNMRRLSDYPAAHGATLHDQLTSLFGLFEQKSMEVLILDQTRPDVGLPVLKVIVPGMRHFWARYAPGRLYDVPVQMGWLKTPTVEDDLNPITMFV
jgi:ribosomal protein S12 methylthiotransferase accessory factor